jgi:glycosyltransferase involved in cell wall biosynthesis
MTNTIPKISIIIPVFNAGKRFTKCLDSLVEQTLKEIEIVLVIDCPTDGSDAIAKEYAKDDSRIIIIENKYPAHIGLSRNKGIAISSGKYIGFSDHDDCMEKTMFEELYNYAEKHQTEMVIGTSRCIGLLDETSNFDDWNIEEDVYEMALSDLIQGGRDIFTDPKAANIHPNLYLSSVIKSKNIQFIDTRLITPEDRLFNIEYLLHIKKARVYDKILYYHEIHSLSESKKSTYKSFEKRAAGKKYIYDLLNANAVYTKYRYQFLTTIKAEFSEYAINNLIISKNIFKYWRIIQYLKQYPFTKDAFKTVSNDIFDACSRFDKFIKKITSFIYLIN